MFKPIDSLTTPINEDRRYCYYAWTNPVTKCFKFEFNYIGILILVAGNLLVDLVELLEFTKYADGLTRSTHLCPNSMLSLVE